MKPAKKRCEYCGRWYDPDPHTARQQKACSRPECRLARLRQKYRSWVKRHPWHSAQRRVKNRAWAAAYPDYWRRRRAVDREYARRDNVRRAAAMRKARCSAKQTASGRVVVEKLRAIETLREAGCSAKQTALSRRVGALEDYVLSSTGVVCSAKQTDIAPGGGPGP